VNTREKNKYEMLEAVYGFYENEKDNFLQLPSASAVFAEINSIIKEIALNEKIIQEGTKGKINSRDDSQVMLIQNALVLAGAIYGYAAEIGNADLMTFADINTKTISRLRNSEIPIFVEKIIEKADEIGDALIPLGITADKRTAAHALLNDYIDKYGLVNTGIVSKKTAHETVGLLFKKADIKLKILDKLMLGFKNTNPLLYSKYSTARGIFDKVSRHQIPAEETPQTENTPA